MHLLVATTMLLATVAMAAPKSLQAPVKRANTTEFQFPILTDAFTFQVPISGIWETGSTTEGAEIVISGSSGTIVNEASFTDIVWSGDLIFGNDVCNYNST